MKVRLARRPIAAAVLSLLSINLALAITPADTTVTATDPPATSTDTNKTDPNAAANASNATQLDAVVVTGGRVETTVGQSTTPVTVISAATLQATGQANLRDALVQLSPSISHTSYGADNAEFTDELQLDGLSPDHVLVLVNGKRRHGSANIVQDPGLDQGSTGVDIDMIPVDLIDHIEILRDGAAAQYGSDAIAGVVNIILKSRASGGTLSTTSGQTYKGDGFKNTTSASIGLSLGGNGFLDLAAEYDRINHAIRTGPDYADGLYGENTPAAIAYMNANGYAPPYPIGPAYRNPWSSDTASTRQIFGFNAGYDFTDNVEAYAFGTFGHRYAESYENYRPPYVDPEVYPNGFTPIFTIDENDYSITGGVKDDNFFGWSVDLSTTYGADRDNLGLVHSVNPSLTDSPTAFDIGSTSNSQLTGNLDFTRPFQLSALAQPLNFAFGFEARRDTFQIQPGDVYSYEDGGASSEAGFNPYNSGQWSRNVSAVYIDLSTHITDKWQADVAARYEHYSDAGNTRNAKVSTRYDFTPQVAVRASASTGFHAPSLAEEHFSSLAVTPDSASAQLPSDSAGAAALGAQPLKPEKATNLNIGLVLNPLPNWNVTADAYQINIRNRIVAGGTVYGLSAVDAMTAAGFPVPPYVVAAAEANPDTGLASVWYFTNGANTRTRGLDLTSTYHADYGYFGKVDWDLSANLNTTRITHLVTEDGEPILNVQQMAYLTSTTPKTKVILGGVWQLGKWGVSVHETYWGATTDQLSYIVGPESVVPDTFYPWRNKAMFTTDFEVRYNVTKKLQIALGANNVFDRYPSKIPYVNALEGQLYDTQNSQVGYDGGYYYLRAAYQF
jgi:iron complex outermembrane recepter protein